MMQRISRKSSLLALGAAMGGAMLAPARADTVPLRVGILPITTNVPYYAADKFGYFTAENLACSAQVIRGGAAAIPAMLTGSLDVLFSNSTTVAQAIAKGIDLRLILTGTIVGDKPPDAGALVKRKDSAIRTGKDLEGKTIAVNTLHDISWMMLTAWIASTGGDVSKVQIVELAQTAMVEAIKQKRVVASMIIDPAKTVALADPALDVAAWPPSQSFAGGPMSFFVVTGEFAQRRPSDVRAFVRAYKRGAAWATANLGKQPYYDLVADLSGLNVDLLRQITPVPPQSIVVPSSLARLVAVMRQTGMLDADLDLRTKIFS
jgi:NitT/TauT family transport system substrate-binding protein